jgi:hypothetical protein
MSRCRRGLNGLGMLKTAINTRANHFGALPSLDHWVDAAAFCGYKIGFTTESGVARLGGDLLQLPRIEVKGDWTLETFAGALEKT